MMTRQRQSQPFGAASGDLQVVEGQLDNGLKVLICPVHQSPVVICDLFYPVGSAHEPPGKSGLAHFLEHMLFKGTDRFPKGQIDLLAYANAGHANAETGPDFTHYWFELPSDRWDLALAIEADRMLSAVFDPREVEAERQVIIEERNGDLDAPAGQLDREHQALSYLIHPYRNPILGWPDDLQRLTVEDLHAFYRVHYHPAQAILVLVGDLTPSTAMKKAREMFRNVGANRKGPHHSPDARALEYQAALAGLERIQEPVQHGKRSFVLEEPDTVARGLLGWHTVPRGHDDNAALTVLVDILASCRRARLYHRLVERDQLVTWIDVTHEPGRYGGRVVCQIEAVPDVEPAHIEAIIQEELVRLLEDGPRPEELRRTRRRLEAAWRWGREDVGSLSMGLGQYALTGDWRDWYRELCAAQEVTAKEVRAVLERYLVDEGLTAGWVIPRAPVRPRAKPIRFPPSSASGSHSDSPTSTIVRSASPLEHGPSTSARLSGALTAEGWPDVPPISQGAHPHSAGSVNLEPHGVKRWDASTAAAERANLPNHGKWQTPLPRRMMLLDDFRPQREVLPSGLRLITDCRAGLGIVALELFVDGGLMRETKPGVAHLLGRVLEDEAGQRHGRDWIALLEDRGGGIEILATGLSLRVLSEDLGLAVSAMAALVTEPALSEETIAKTQAKVIAELRADRDDPSLIVDRVFREQIYGKHPLARDPRGTLAAVRAISRQDLHDHHEKLFVPNNSCLVISGDFDQKALLSLLKRHFKSWLPRSLPNVALPPLKSNTKPRRKIVERPCEQMHILLGHLGVKRDDPDYNALMVLDHILGCGSGFTDRLSRTLRDEMGLVYSVGGSITDSADVVPGVFRVAIGTSPDRCDAAIQAALEQIQAVCRGEFDDVEVENAKMYLSGSNVFDFQTIEQRTERLLELERWSLSLDEPRQWPAILAKITPDMVRSAAREHLHPDQIVLVEVGPHPERSAPQD